MIKVTILFASLATGLNTASTPRATEDRQQVVTRYQMECVEQTRVDADVIVMIKRKRWSISGEQLPLVKNWALCVLMKSGIMTKEGVYKIDIALQKVPPVERPFVERQIDSCLTSKPIPARDIAYHYVKCFQSKNSNHSFVVSAF